MLKKTEEKFKEHYERLKQQTRVDGIWQFDQKAPPSNSKRKKLAHKLTHAEFDLEKELEAARLEYERAVKAAISKNKQKMRGVKIYTPEEIIAFLDQHKQYK